MSGIGRFARKPVAKQASNGAADTDGATTIAANPSATMEQDSADFGFDSSWGGSGDGFGGFGGNSGDSFDGFGGFGDSVETPGQGADNGTKASSGASFPFQKKVAPASATTAAASTPTTKEAIASPPGPHMMDQSLAAMTLPTSTPGAPKKSLESLPFKHSGALSLPSTGAAAASKSTSQPTIRPSNFATSGLSLQKTAPSKVANSSTLLYGGSNSTPSSLSSFSTDGGFGSRKKSELSSSSALGNSTPVLATDKSAAAPFTPVLPTAANTAKNAPSSFSSVESTSMPPPPFASSVAVRGNSSRMSFESTGTELSSTTRKDAVPSTPMATVTVGQSLTTTRPPSQDLSTPAATERHMDTNFPRSNRDQGEDSSKPTADLLPTANSETNQVRTDFSAQSYESPPENPAREQTGGTTPQAFRGTLSQFDTSLVSPEQAFGSPQDVENNTPGLAGFGQNATLPTGMPLNEQNVDDGEDECFDDIFQKIMDTHIRFGDDFQLYEDQMLYLTENLCLQHGEMLVFEDENLDLINELDEFQAELEQMIIEATG